MYLVCAAGYDVLQVTGGYVTKNGEPDGANAARNRPFQFQDGSKDANFGVESVRNQQGFFVLTVDNAEEEDVNEQAVLGVDELEKVRHRLCRVRFSRQQASGILAQIVDQAQMHFHQGGI